MFIFIICNICITLQSFLGFFITVLPEMETDYWKFSRLLTGPKWLKLSVNLNWPISKRSTTHMFFDGPIVDSQTAPVTSIAVDCL